MTEGSGTPPTSDPARTDTTLVACMRNEGLFIVEWVAYHSLMGFADVLVITNGCTDGSDLLLDRLQELGHLTHVRQYPPPGQSPQLSALKLAFAHPVVLAHEWLLHIDADEFLFVDTGDGTVRALLEAVGPADVVAIGWKCFGNGGMTRWEGGNVLEQFTRSQGRPTPRVTFHKSLFRHRLFEGANAHMPKHAKRHGIRAVTTDGRPFNPWTINRETKSRYRLDLQQMTFRNAAIHHYAIKSDDLYVMKNDRGYSHAVAHTKYYLNSKAYRSFNRNETENRNILSRWPEISARIAALRSDPTVARIEADCIASFRARRDLVLTPEQLAAWTFRPDGAPATGPADRMEDEAG